MSLQPRPCPYAQLGHAFDVCNHISKAIGHDTLKDLQHGRTYGISTHVGLLDDHTASREVNACCKAASCNNHFEDSSIVRLSHDAPLLAHHTRILEMLVAASTE